MPRVVHFEINADDLDRAEKFYSSVFGWQTQKWEGPETYILLTTGDKEQPGINGGMMKRQAPGAAYYNVIDVPSVDEFSKKITGAGGTQTVPKSPVPGVGWVAYFTDTEDNPFGIIEFDEKAGQ